MEKILTKYRELSTDLDLAEFNLLFLLRPTTKLWQIRVRKEPLRAGRNKNGLAAALKTEEEERKKKSTHT